MSNMNQSAFMPPNTGGTINLTLSASTAKTAALRAGVYRLCPTVACQITVGPASSVVAAVTDLPLAAGSVEYFTITEGTNAPLAIAAIAGGAGVLSITPMT